MADHKDNAAYLVFMSLEFTDHKIIAIATHWNFTEFDFQM